MTATIHTVDTMAAVEALAESWASIDGKADGFARCKAHPKHDDVEGYYTGYLADAMAMVERLAMRGYALRRVEVP